MRRIFSVILLLIFLFPSTIYANGAGLPAFLKFNGKFSNPNPLQIFGITAQTFLIPQDYAPENYVVNQPIQFEIDQSPLETVFPIEALKKTKYSWEFGDGSLAEGLQNTHAYSKIGSYILIITINIYNSDSTIPTKFVDSFLLNILPQKGYNQLPQAVIQLHSKNEQDIAHNLAYLNLKDQVSFDASRSKPSGGIVEFLWNFGDGETAVQSVATHKYSDQNPKTLVLRVKDKDGFIADSFLGLNHDPKIANSDSLEPQKQKNEFDFIPIMIVASSGLAITIVYISYRRRNRMNQLEDSSEMNN